MVVNSKDSKKVADQFGDEVSHIRGNLFRVKRGSINIAKAGLSSSDGKLVYGNPRWFVNKNGKPEARGLDRGKMEELKGSIMERGMDHPIRLRVADDGILEIVNGERRFRAIGELVEDERDCFDQSSGEIAPASEVHEWVECRIEYMDDATALCCALKLNETGEVIGETASLQVVKVLRESGYDDQEILKATGKSIAWLRETERLIGLDEVCLEHLRSDMINRQVALRLAKVKDVEERVSMLERIKAAAEERHAETVRQSKQKAERARAKLGESIVDSFEAEIEGKESAPEKSKAERKAKKSLEKAEAELRKSEGKKPKAVTNDVHKAEGTNKPLTSAKILSLYLEPIAELIEGDGVCERGAFDVASLSMIHAILEAILNGDKEMWDILDGHCRVEEVAEESESEEEASEESEHEEDSYIDASSDEDEESADDSDEDEEEEDDDDSYAEDSADDSDESLDEMTAELEREFEEELRNIM